MDISILLTLLCTTSSVYGSFNQETDWNSAQSFHDFHVLDLQGNEISLDKYRGHVVLAFNGATRCPVSAKTFKILQSLHQQYGEPDGLKIAVFVVDGLAKPSGTSEEIQEYIKGINISYDVYAKINSDGDAAHPLYKWMRSQLPNQEKIQVASKILIDKNGKVVAKYPSTGPITDMENTMKQYF